MRGGRRVRQIALEAEIRNALAVEQPDLDLVTSDPELVVQGSFLLRGGGEAFDQFQIPIVVPTGFPECEPKVFETGNRILPKNETRHINPDRACCFGVWEEWLAQTNDPSFRGFLKGPVHDYFLSQFFFERDGTWRLGERSHGAKGLIEAYAHVLAVEATPQLVLSYLEALTRDWPKGHLPCPCGSRLIVRKCHRQGLWALHERVSPRLAKQMLKRLLANLPKPRKR